MLFMHCVRAAASRTFCTAGTSRAIRIAMMAMTTSNSMSVKADRERTDMTKLHRSADRANAPGRDGFLILSRPFCQFDSNFVVAGLDVAFEWREIARIGKLTGLGIDDHILRGDEHRVLADGRQLEFIAAIG